MTGYSFPEGWDTRMILPAEEPKKTILEEAKDRVYGDRAATYGHPKEHFQATVTMLNAYLIRRGWTPTSGLIAEDWPQIMHLEKVVRQAGSLMATGELHRDSMVDQAGWAAACERLLE